MSIEPRPAILIVDDQLDVLEALRLLLRREGFQPVTANSPAKALELVGSNSFEAALVDLNFARDTTSGEEGLDLLAELLARAPMLPVIVMTAWGSIDTAVEAMRRGARDYLQKPWDNVRLLATLHNQVELYRALRRGELLSAETSRQREQHQEPVIARSSAMLQVLKLVDAVATSDTNVLVIGEHGTGKELIARRLHAFSHRADRPLVAVNAAALSEGLLESELFGHVKGAFTGADRERIGCFELADRGTLFLDEIGSMPVAQQAKLLRVLQTGELTPVGSSRVRRADVRVVAATNANLAEMVARAQFREDLLYRLNTIEISVPALRDRREDILALSELFLARYARRYERTITAFGPAAVEALCAHPWPGNVRELEHAVERAALLARRDTIEVEDLGLKPDRGAVPTTFEDMTLKDAERHILERALARADGNINDAARRLGLSRSALYRRLQGFGIRSPQR